jgi:hypothetical protein
MAKLDPSELLSFSAAASALTLTTSRKLIRNFRYYRSEKPESIDRLSLEELCRNIRRDAFGLHNLMESEPKHPTFFVAFSKQIFDQLEELHRKLLFFDADLIAEIIPEIDQQRWFWNNLIEPEFYDDRLIEALEHEIPQTLYRIEKLLARLPDSIQA